MQGCGSALVSGYGSLFSFFVNADPVQDFDVQKLENFAAEKNYNFLIKKCNLLIPSSSYRRSLHFSKVNI
jgi:hypothetical protein